jgi:DNA-binding CsgD family transcriptional regulator
MHASPMNEPSGGWRGLTTRERQVLELVAVGAANQRIARALGMSEHTVKFHLSSIFRKLGATNRTQAAAALYRQSLPRD